MNNWRVKYTEQDSGCTPAFKIETYPEVQEESPTASSSTTQPWHFIDCQGECIACLIEREVKNALGNQGLAYLHKHVYNKT